MRTRPAAFALALSSLLLIAAAVAVDGWMVSLPTHVRAACTDSPNNVTYITPSGTYCEGPNPLMQLWLGPLIAVLGIGLFVVAWRLDRRPGERPRQGWNAVRAWGAPLLWLAAIPAASALLGYLILSWELSGPSCETTYFFGSTSICPVSAVVPSVLVPGLLYLVPVRWLSATNPRRRSAATAASVLGVASLVGFLWALFSQGPTIEIDSGILSPPLLPPGEAGFVIGTVGWLSALIALLVIAKLPLGSGIGAEFSDSALPVD
ncbi:MAG: hypothetical protein ACYDAL_14640 [Candidatus Dormibacteraceae bacterium]